MLLARERPLYYINREWDGGERFKEKKGGGAWGLKEMDHGMTIILSTESGVEVKDFRRGRG